MRRGPVHADLRMKAYLVVTVLGVVFAWSGTAADPELITPDQLMPLSQGATIAKTVVSSRLRFIFFVRLEGSGHHFAREAFEGPFEDHDDLQEVDECNITPSIYVPQTLNGTAAHYRKKRESLRSEMKKLAALEKDLQAPGSFLTVQRTNRAQIKRCGKGPEYSYPNGHGPDKALAFADLQLLAQLAEEEGVDLRILYLQRSAKGLLLFDISHRHFQDHILGKDVKDSRREEKTILHYAQILLESAAAVHSSLSELGPGIVVCNFYNKMADKEQARNIANFLSSNEVVGGYLEDSLQKHARLRNSTDGDLPYPDVFAVMERIKRKLDVIEVQHCDHRALHGS